MLTTAIQKDYANVCFIQSKTENPILSFLVWNFFVLVFLKEKNLITYIAMFDCFWYYFYEKGFHGKKQRQARMWFYEKTFSYKAGVLF